ncbi:MULTISPECIES: acyltransferase [unclassified Pseudomonas]|uniref:acyltransferase family protein n=1 Tax=unclassified Pseudomonas TaxID=196821 RepID=UPI000C86C707|nr:MULTISPECIES: acyltransferase [unclassified Pseudomonas]PMV90023.1 acyltransferase [Pseudomonas sp. GW101-1A09]PMV91031.1 acyltransferase [Pseudomonas sp. FW306-2-2C-B10A]PMW03171.1 acyltransferase [Pseudomonas sp. GW460-C8]PMW07750.1 acyltransferase [Pseudomonas sp. MPR-TSA4]PMW11986.1 acyltransferase [Pseudomonas sp. GW456-11-11-14-TSB2]
MTETNPFIALAAYLLAIVTAALLLRAVPKITRHLEHSGESRYASIDGLRGYLAFGVFVHHSVITWIFLRTGVIEFPPSNFYSQLGQGSVALFFMITGFLFWNRLLTQGRQHDWLAFAVSRVFRLYPLYLPLMLIVFVTVFYLQNWELKDPGIRLAGQILAWLTFDRPDVNQYHQTGMLISNVTWTLGYEVFFYLALPLAGMVFIYRGSWLQVVLCLIGIYALYQLVGWEHSLKKHFLASFLGGIGAAYWIRRPHLMAWGQTRQAGIIALLALAIAFTAFNRAFNLLPLLLLSLFFVIVASGNTLFGALKPRSIRWLGEISYSTYLLHGFVLWVMVQRLPLVMDLDARDTWTYLSLLAVCTCLLIVISSLTFLYIEKPGMSAGRKLLQWLRQGKKAEKSLTEKVAR